MGSHTLLQGIIPTQGWKPSLHCRQILYRLSHQGRLIGTIHSVQFSHWTVQSLNCDRLLATLWTAACQASLSITNSRSLLKLMSIESMMPSTISSSVVPFFSCLRSFPVSGSFPMSQFFASGGQSIGVSASTSILPMNIQDWFPLGWTGWISLYWSYIWSL